MRTTAIRQKLHNYLEVADDKKIRAIYTMMEAEVENEIVEHDDDFKFILSERLEEYKSGKVNLISEEESKNRIYDILAARNK